MADQEGMEADRHHPAGLGAVLVEPVQLVAQHPTVRCRAVMQMRKAVMSLSSTEYGMATIRPFFTRIG